MSFRRMAGLSVALLAVAGSASTQSRTTDPVATYWMTAYTTVGMSTSSGASPMAMLSAMTSGGAPKQSLLLQLGTTRAAEGRAQAEHLAPVGLGAGPRLALSVKPADRNGEGVPIEERPAESGRMLIYYGCGHETRGRQPIVVQLDQDGARQIAGIVATHRAAQPNPPSANSSRTYAEWPGRGRPQTPSGSLVGEHLVTGNYTPDIRFNLDASQDFLAPLQLTGLGQPGPVSIGWNTIPHAKGYLVSTMGQNEAGDLVIWSSSETPAVPMNIPDLLTPADLTRLQAGRTILSASATSCAVPTAVTTAAPDSHLRVIAYGGEVNIAWPPRPTQPGAVWNVESVVKVRYNSTAGAILSMGADDADEEAAAPPSPLDILPGGQAARALGSALGRFRR